MIADVRRWGNSLAIRVPSADAEALGLREGDQVKVVLKKVPKDKVDVSSAPLFHEKDGRTDISEKHDEILYGWDHPRR